MAISQSPLPEGTDSIVNDTTNDVDFAPAPALSTNISSGGGSGGGKAGDVSAKVSDASAKLGDATAKVSETTAGLRAQAADTARDYAAQGKDRAVGALDNVIRLVDDAAGTIDEKVGAQYGDYARRASGMVAGFADTLREKDVDELFSDAREAVRKSPAIAIGAAAAVGFVLARMIKAGVPETGDSTASSKPTPPTATTVPTDASN